MRWDAASGGRQGERQGCLSPRDEIPTPSFLFLVYMEFELDRFVFERVLNEGEHHP
jgi:hypothetical protein